MKTKELQRIANLAVAAAGGREEFFGQAFALLKESFEGREPSVLLFHPGRKTFFRRIGLDETGSIVVRAISLSLEEFPGTFVEGLLSESPFKGQGPYPVNLPEFSGTFLCHPIPFGEVVIGLLVTGDRASRGETVAPFVIPMLECFTVAEWHREADALAPLATERVETEQCAAIQEKYRQTYLELQKATGKAEAAGRERDVLGKQVEKASTELQSMAAELSLLRLDLIETGGVRNVMDLLEGELLNELPGLAEGHFRDSLAHAAIEAGLLVELHGTDPVIVFGTGDWPAPGSVDLSLKIIGPLLPLLASRRQEIGIATRGGKTEVAPREAPADLLLLPVFDAPDHLSGIAILAGGNLPWPPPQQRAESLKARMSEVFSLREAESRHAGGREGRIS